MVCVKCREGQCGDCVDNTHRKNLAEGAIPGVRVGGNWCDCGHDLVKANTPGDPNDC